jgi:hypothetical protein
VANAVARSRAGTFFGQSTWGSAIAPPQGGVPSRAARLGCKTLFCRLLQGKSLGTFDPRVLPWAKLFNAFGVKEPNLDTLSFCECKAATLTAHCG